MIEKPYADANPTAVVVEAQDTLAAVEAMIGPGWCHYLTVFAKAKSVCLVPLGQMVVSDRDCAERRTLSLALHKGFLLLQIAVFFGVKSHLFCFLVVSF